MKYRVWMAAAGAALLVGSSTPLYAMADNNAEVKGSYNETNQNVYRTVLQLGANVKLDLPDSQALVYAQDDRAAGSSMIATPVQKGGKNQEAYAWLSGKTAEKGREAYGYYFTFYKNSQEIDVEAPIAVLGFAVPSGYEEGTFWCLNDAGRLYKVCDVEKNSKINFQIKERGYYFFLKPLASGGGESGGGNESGGSGSGGNGGSGNTGTGGNGTGGSGSSSGGSGNGSSGSPSGGSGNGSSGGSSSGSSGSGSSGRSDRGSSSSSSASSETPSQDARKGYTTSSKGILTGKTGSMEQDGYSHWIQDEHGWRLRYADGTWAKGSQKVDLSGISGTQGQNSWIREEYHWEKVNGNWYAFGADSYARFGWICEEKDGVSYWYYIDENGGRKSGWHLDAQDQHSYYLDAEGQMVTDWQKIDGKWYYFNPASPSPTWGYDEAANIWTYLQVNGNHPLGSLYRNEQTPDGHFVDANGVWNGR